MYSYFRMQKFSIYCLLFFLAFAAIAQEKTPVNVQLTLQNFTTSPYFCEGNQMTLVATPVEPGFSYQWFLDGQPLETTVTNTLPVRRAGNYSVTVSNAQMTGTSSKVRVEACPDNSAELAAIWAQALKDGKAKPPKETQSAFTATISSVNPILCNGNTSAMLVAQPQGAQYTYQWQYASCLTCTYTNQSGQTNDTLTTSTTGFYKVLVTEGTTTITANPFRVASVPYATLTDQNNDPGGIITVTPGQSASLKVNFTGIGPFYFSYNDGLSDKYVSNVADNPYTLTVTPEENRRYRLNYVGNNTCGSTGGDLLGSVRVVVDAATSVTLPTPTTLNVCAGSTIDIPYTTIGTWAGPKNLTVRLLNELDGSTVTSFSGQSDSPLRVTLPSYLTPFSQCRVAVLPIVPASVAGPVISSYILTVNSVGCNPKPIVYVSPANQACSSVYLSTGNPFNSTSNYQWFRNGVALSGTASSGFYAYESGNYHVKVTNAAANYIDSSAVQTITLLAAPVTITSPNTVLCGSNTSAVLTATTATTGGTWQWYKSGVPISGAVSATYTATTTGSYQAEYSKGGCTASGSINVTNYNTATLTTLSGGSSQVITPGTTAQLKAVFAGQGPWTFRLYDGSNYKNMSATANPHLITVQPEQNRSYNLDGIVSSNCSNSGSSSLVKIEVDPTTSLTLTAPASLNVCAGSTIEIPYTTAGTWTNDRKLYIELIDANNNYVSNSYQGYFSQNPIRYTLPTTLTLNAAYKVRIYSSLPYFNSVTSSYQLTVTSTGCQPTATIQSNSSSIQCGSVPLFAYPYRSDYVYQWFRNGSSISGAMSNYYYAPQTGSYTVKVTNAAAGYNSTSAATSVEVTMPPVSISPTNGAVCNGGSVTLNATPADAAVYDYQWYYQSFNGGEYSAVSGAVLASYTATAVGNYYVVVTQKTGNCSVSSSSVSITQGGTATLRNANGTTADVVSSPGQTVPLTVTMTGQPPFVFQYSDGTYTRRITTNNSTYTLNVTPEQNRSYYLFDFANSCGSGGANGTVNVIVNAATTLTLSTPSNLNACAGGSVEIPYTTVGTWSGSRNLFVALYNPVTGNSITAYTISNPANPMIVRVPASLSIGSTFQIRISGSTPYFTTVGSSYNFTVASTGCTPTPQIQESFPGQCGRRGLYIESLTGYNYQWYRDGNATGNTSNGYTATVSGNYTVRVTGPNGYDVTSAPYTVTIGSVTKPVINQTGAGGCTDGTPFTLSSSVTDPSFTYQWYYATTSNGPFLPVSGGNASSLTTNQPGGYFVTVQSGECQSESDRLYTCPLLVDFKSASICRGGGITVNYSPNFCCFSENTVSLHLVEAVSGTVVMSNLASLKGFSSYTFSNVAIPASVPSGTYRFVVTSSGPMFTSPKSVGVLTVTNSTAPAPPTITAVPSSISLGQSTTLTASGCNGTLQWTDNSTAPATRTLVPNGTTVYSATCIDVNGCTTAVGSVTVSLECDPMEPNNTYTSATITGAANYLSPEVCLDSKNDTDWYAYVHNNKVYYIRVTSASNVYGYYKLSVSVVNDSLRIETLPSSGSNLYTYVELYVHNGIFYLGGDYSGGVNNFSLLKYKLPAPCPAELDLYSTLLDIAPGQTNTAKALQINAANKIGDGATATYYGQNTVLLLPGFQTNFSTGGSFQAAIQGCN
jgi:large repetitive protein